MLIQSPAFESYNRSWQLNVYFQLRFRDVAQHLEDQLLPPARTADLFASRDDLEVPETFERYAALAALQQACLTISSPKTLLAPLAPKFFRLLIQVHSRYPRHERQLASNRQSRGRRAGSPRRSKRRPPLAGLCPSQSAGLLRGTIKNSWGSRDACCTTRALRG